MKLLIVIPALNEEQSIGAIIEACLAAREVIIRESPVTEVAITVVSDGSTDRTVEIASSYATQIDLIVFEKNQGYGAAIQAGWSRSDADLLGFLDADGTCDPKFFAPLCREIVERDADVACGSRMNADSRMPRLRRVGNYIFAYLLSRLSKITVQDSASGMRVVRRTSASRLLPLPNGLHFTPAMTARALLSPHLSLREIPMSYHERAGRSKLAPIRDGFRFLGTILRTALLYRPGKLMGILALSMAAVTVAMMVRPVIFYFQHRELEEWMIYRFLTAEMLMVGALTVICTAHLAQKTVWVSLTAIGEGRSSWSSRLLGSPWFPSLPIGSAVLGVAFVWRALGTFTSQGIVTEHWSRFVAMMFFLSIAIVLTVTRLADYCLDLLGERLSYLERTEIHEHEHEPRS